MAWSDELVVLLSAIARVQEVTLPHSHMGCSQKHGLLLIIGYITAPNI